MKDIQSIKNVTVYQDLNTSTDFYQNLSLYGDCSDCIVRSITYSGPAIAEQGCYLIWCDLVNDFIGSFAIIVNATDTTQNPINSNPQTHIHLREPLPSNSTIHFKIYNVSAGNRQAVATSTLSGDLAICLDFISYKK